MLKKVSSYICVSILSFIMGEMFTIWVCANNDPARKIIDIASDWYSK